jgi:acyl carrier protein
MNSQFDPEIERRVRDIVADNRGGRPEELRLDATLQEELECYGDDAVELFLALQKEFGIDFTGIQWKRHFRSEGVFIPLAFLYPSWWTAVLPITVRDLVRAASSKRWEYDYTSDAATRVA